MPKSVLAAALDKVLERLPGGATRARSRAQVAFIRWGFEGGQMPKYRRLPKRGFTAPFGKFTEQVRLSDLQRLPVEEVDLLALKQAGVVSELARQAKVILSGSLSSPKKLRGLAVTAGAKKAIEEAGGSVGLLEPAPKVRKLPSKQARADAAAAAKA